MLPWERPAVLATAVVAVLVFSMLRLTPGDPAAVIAGDYASPQDVAKIRASLGLDQPLPVQLGLWFGNLLRGDLGTSIFSGLPVITLIKQRVEPTVALATLTMIVEKAGYVKTYYGSTRPGRAPGTPAGPGCLSRSVVRSLNTGLNATRRRGT